MTITTPDALTEKAKSMSGETRELVNHVVKLLMQRPITEEIAMQIEEIPGYTQLEIEDGEWIGFEYTEDAYMTGEEHGWLETKILILIGQHILANQLGRLYPGDMDFVLSGDTHNLKDRRKPDIAFVQAARVTPSDGYYYGAPDLAVEIKSPSQSKPDIQKKIATYFKYRCQAVWLVLPDDQQIEVYTPDGEVIAYGVGDTIPGGDLLPGLQLAVKDIFTL